MQQDPTTTTASALGNNRNLLLGLGLGALALAGAVGVAVWLGNQTTIKRKRPSKKAAAATSASAKSRVGPDGKKRVVRADEAKITLDKAAQMTIEQIQTALEQAEKEDDKASQINILFLLASSLLQQEQLERQHIEAAVQYYNIALQFATEINSELLGPILLELAVLSFNFKNFPQAMALFEQGLNHLLDTPDEQVDATSTKHMLSIFVMLSESYFNAKQLQRGVDFLLDFLKRAEARNQDLHAELFPALMLSVGEFTYALKQFNECSSYLEQGLAKATAAGSKVELGPDTFMLYNYYLAWSNVKAENNVQAIRYLEKYLEAAKVAKAPVETTLESIMSLIICYKESDQLDRALQTVDRALQTLKQLDEAAHPLQCLKQYYFLGLYCLNKLEQLDRARDLLERAYQLAKSNATLAKEMPWGTIAIDLAEAYHKLKLREEALKMIESGLTALRERDTSLVAPALIRKAKIHSEQGDKAAAALALEEALRVAEEHRQKEASTPAAAAAEESQHGTGWLCRFLKFQLGKMYTLMGQLTRGEAFLNDSFTSFVGTTDLEIRTVVLATIASNLIQSGRKDEGLRKIQEVLEVLATPTTQKLAQGDIRTELGECYLFLGDHARAQQELEAALDHFGRDKNEKSELLVLVRLAAVHDWLGAVDRAAECLEQAEQARLRDNSAIHQGSVGVGFAFHHLTVGDVAQAQARADATAVFLDPACCGATPLNVLAFHALLAETSFWTNRIEAATQHFGRCLEHISTVPHARENVVGLLTVQARLAALALHMENRHQDANALAMLDRLLPLAREKGGLHHVAQLLALAALAKARAGDASTSADAAALMAEAISVADETADRRVQAFVHRLAGALYTRHASADRLDDGRRSLDQALALARQLGDQLLEAVVLRDLALVAFDTAADDDKERAWREAVAPALELAERTGNQYLAARLAHLPGTHTEEAIPIIPAASEQQPQQEEEKQEVVAKTEEAAPVAEPVVVAAEEEVKDEPKKEEAEAEAEPAAAPVAEQQQQEEENQAGEKTFAEVVQEAEKHEEEQQQAEEAAPEQQAQEEQPQQQEEENRAGEKTFAEVVQEAEKHEEEEQQQEEEPKQENPVDDAEKVTIEDATEQEEDQQHE